MEGDAFIIEENGKKQIVCTLDDVNLLGDHNYENILAAIAVTYSMGVPVSYIKEGIKRFKGVEHRIEYVDTVKGVAYYNDSKGTNPDAAIKGKVDPLVGLKENVILGKLIPAGTGMRRYRDVKISTDENDFTIGDEIDFDDEEFDIEE